MFIVIGILSIIAAGGIAVVYPSSQFAGVLFTGGLVMLCAGIELDNPKAELKKVLTPLPPPKAESS